MHGACYRNCRETCERMENGISFAVQIKQYHEDNYLIVENFLTEECEKLRTRCRVLVDENDFNHRAVTRFASLFFKGGSWAIGDHGDG